MAEEEPPSPPDDEGEEGLKRLRELVRSAQERSEAIAKATRLAAGESAGPREVSELPYSALQRRDLAQDIKLKKWYAIALLAGLGVQMAIADGVFIAYAQVGAHWNIDASVMQAWLSATVVEVVGVVFVVTRYLFPRRDRRHP
jgi:Na+/H+ antiporter NhaA